MIQINLLPPELKKKKQKLSAFKMPDIEQLAGVPLPLVIGGFFAFLVIVQLAAFGLATVAQKKFEAFQTAQQSILPQVKEVRRLKQQLGVTQKRVKAIDEIADKRLVWAKKLNDLSDSIPSGIWLTSLFYDERFIENKNTGRSKPGRAGKLTRNVKKKKNIPALVRMLVITGHAYSKLEDPTASIAKFIESLRNNAGFTEDFSEIELGGPIQEDKVEDVETMSFRINCVFNRDVR